MENIKCINCGKENTLNHKYCGACWHELLKENTNTNESIVQSQIKKKNNKSKAIGLIVGAIVFIIAYFLMQQFFRPSIDKEMMKVASEFNKTCPIMVDQFTRLDNSVALPHKELRYNFTLINSIKSEVSTDTLHKYVAPNIINNAKTNPDMKYIRDNKITLVYYYRDKNGEFVWQLKVTPDMYK